MKKTSVIVFHGAFCNKAKAKAKERKVKGFIRIAKVRGHRRYIVMAKKGR